jgi:hypothetical protein
MNILRPVSGLSKCRLNFIKAKKKVSFEFVLFVHLLLKQDQKSHPKEEYVPICNLIHVSKHFHNLLPE